MTVNCILGPNDEWVNYKQIEYIKSFQLQNAIDSVVNSRIEHMGCDVVIACSDAIIVSQTGKIFLSLGV